MKNYLFTYLAVVLTLIFVSVSSFAANTLNYTRPGGSKWVVGGELDVVNSGTIKHNGLVQNAYVDVTITSAQMLALNATAQTLVAAPGAGYAIAVRKVMVFLDYNAAAYAGIAAGEDLSFKYNSSAGVEIIRIETDPFLTAVADELRIGYPSASGGFADFEPVANAPIVLHLLTGEIITGNSPVKVRVYYDVIPSTL